MTNIKPKPDWEKAFLFLRATFGESLDEKIAAVYLASICDWEDEDRAEAAIDKALCDDDVFQFGQEVGPVSDWEKAHILLGSHEEGLKTDDHLIAMLSRLCGWDYGRAKGAILEALRGAKVQTTRKFASFKDEFKDAYEWPNESWMDPKDCPYIRLQSYINTALLCGLVISFIGTLTFRERETTRVAMDNAFKRTVLAYLAN